MCAEVRGRSGLDAIRPMVAVAAPTAVLGGAQRIRCIAKVPAGQRLSYKIAVDTSGSSLVLKCASPGFFVAAKRIGPGVGAR